MTYSVKKEMVFRQRGITLVVSLIFLLLLTILGVTAISTSTLQEKMSGNLRDQDVAFQAAESALRAGEDAINLLWVAGRPSPISSTNCTNCAWNTGTTDPSNDTWWNLWKNEYGGTGKQLTETIADPFFVIEHAANITDSGHRGDRYGPPSSTEYYRITSRAQGVTPFSQSMLESTYRIQN